jgi:hypothetical protein
MRETIRILAVVTLLVIPACADQPAGSGGDADPNTADATAEVGPTDVRDDTPIDAEVPEDVVPDTPDSARDVSPSSDVQDISETGADTEADTGRCPAGEHVCSGRCVEDDSILHCGDRCSPCPGDPRGEPACRDGECVLDCGEGYRSCGGECVRCPNNAASVGCTDGECVATSCPETHRLCGGECARCENLATDTTCGPEGACRAVSCPEDYHLCDGECLADDSPQSCGDRCEPCPTIPNSHATCKNETCGIKCDAGYRPCSNGCCKWNETKVASGVFYHEMGLDSAGEVHLLYRTENLSQNKIIYEHLASGTKTVLRTASQAGVTLAFKFDIAIDPATDEPLVAYSTNKHHPTLARKTSTGWQKTTLTHLPIRTPVYDIEFAPDGDPVLLSLAGGSSSGFDLAYSEKTAGAWQRSTIAKDVQNYSADLEIRDDGTPFVTYRLSGTAGQPEHHVRFAHRDSSGWPSEVVARIEGAYPFASMEFDPSGTLWLVYQEKGVQDPFQNGIHDNLELARRTSSGWDKKYLDRRAFAGRHPDLGFDASGKLFVSYVHRQNFVFGVGDPSDASSWESAQIYGRGWVGTLPYTQLEIDPNGQPVVSHIASTSTGDDLYLVR